MRYLLDTHFLFWLPIGGSGLSRAARSLINNPENGFLFSTASIWEIVLKKARYRDLAYDPREVRQMMLENGYTELSVTSEHVLAVDSLASIHRDPFDRLLIAQAIVEGITLLTADATIARYPGPIRKV
jgi:PIN domain nuclease of toxin-antitoxin system